MKFAGLFFHYLFRILDLSRNRVIGWSLECYLRAKAKRCSSVYVSGPCRFANVSGLELGQNVRINVDNFWVCEGGISVGDNTIFARSVTIYSRNHNYSGRALPFDDTNVFRPVVIGRNVWVGANVTILPGACIEDGAIIGGGAVVAGVVPFGSIVGAPKAKVLRERDKEHYRRLDTQKAYHGLE
ncbi:acyltransferase [Sulfitobacter faviae]|uniref:acyltransferase n=1 Tax=Sulfitobacter faviae TaxID=1775881 RepID=UPI003B4342AA